MQVKLDSDNLGVSPMTIGLDVKPKRSKFGVSLTKSLQDPGYLKVGLKAPLDGNYGPEAEALKQLNTSGGDLIFEYKVQIDLEDSRGYLEDEINKLCEEPNKYKLNECPLTRLPDDALQEMLATIATQGASIYRRIFLSDSIEITSHRNGLEAIARPAILSALRRANVIEISVTGSNDPLFPWAFLYADENFDRSKQWTVDPRRFWGFKYEIQEGLTFTSPKKLLLSPLDTLLSICPQIEGMEEHKKFFDQFQGRMEIDYAASVPELKSALANFPGDALYFCGHAHTSDPPSRTECYVKLDDLDLTVDDLENKYKVSKDPILTFLNGCKTGHLKKWNTESMVGFLCEESNHRLCCITTIASVPECFAMKFAEQFWLQFIDGRKCIGEALRLARTEMLSTYNNPLGLIYSLFGCVDTHLN